MSFDRIDDRISDRIEIEKRKKETNKHQANRQSKSALSRFSELLFLKEKTLNKFDITL